MREWNTHTKNYQHGGLRYWGIYRCTRCGGLTTAAALSDGGSTSEVYPKSSAINQAVPTKAKEYLTQALNSLHAPAGAIMLAASGVDALLKEKDYIKGSLYKRIDEAAKDHIITKDMAKWAHQVRLEANDQRHADGEADLPDVADAQKTLDFAIALAEFLFVLPSRVTRGLEETKGKEKKDQ